jgi:hypothetical protein
MLLLGSYFAFKGDVMALEMGGVTNAVGGLSGSHHMVTSTDAASSNTGGTTSGYSRATSTADTGTNTGAVGDQGYTGSATAATTSANTVHSPAGSSGQIVAGTQQNVASSTEGDNGGGQLGGLLVDSYA